MTVTACHRMLVNAIFEQGNRLGLSAMREFTVRTRNGHGFIDVAIWSESIFLAVEVERTNRRIIADFEKAIAVRAKELLIVVPNPKTRRLVEHRVNQLFLRTEFVGLNVFVGCLPRAVERIQHFFPQKSCSN